MIYAVFVLGVAFGAVVGFCMCALLSIADDDDDRYQGPQE